MTVAENPACPAACGWWTSVEQSPTGTASIMTSTILTVQMLAENEISTPGEFLC